MDLEVVLAKDLTEGGLVPAAVSKGVVWTVAGEKEVGAPAAEERERVERERVEGALRVEVAADVNALEAAAAVDFLQAAEAVFHRLPPVVVAGTA